MAQVLAILRDVLGEELIGAYLNGSAVLGGLRARSDIDVPAVSAKRTTRDEKRRAIGRLLAASGASSAAPPPRPLELTIVDGIEGNDIGDGGSGTDRCIIDDGDSVHNCESSS